jgi:hypothetical protein
MEGPMFHSFSLDELFILFYANSSRTKVHAHLSGISFGVNRAYRAEVI